MTLILKSLLLITLALPLLANKSCESALKEAEQAETTTSAATAAEKNENADSHNDKRLPVLPEDEAEARKLLESGGPEVTSPHTDSE